MVTCTISAERSDANLNDQRPDIVAPWVASNQTAVDSVELRLYVTGMTPSSLRAIAHITSLCKECLSNRHQLEIVDIYQNPEMTRADQIIASPTLLKLSPSPPAKLIGSMSDRAKVMAALGLSELE